MTEKNMYEPPGTPPRGDSVWGAGQGGFNARQVMNETPERKSWIKVTVISFVLVLAIAASAFFFLNRQMEAGVVDIEFSMPPKVLSGEPFALSVSISNVSPDILKSGRLGLTLPDGVFFVGQNNDTRYSERITPDIGPGSIVQESFQVLSAQSEDASASALQATFTYQNARSGSAQFQKKMETVISVAGPAVSLGFEAPRQTFSGETVEMKLTYHNNSAKTLEHVALHVDYPPAFSFTSSSVALSKGNNEWNIEQLLPGETGTVMISGRLIGPDESFFSFNALVLGKYSNREYAISSQSASISLIPAPLSVSIVANGKEDYVARTGEDIRYEIHYKNNSSIALATVKVMAKAEGNLFDFSRALSSASFNSVDNVFTWFPGNTPELGLLAPGAEGNVTLIVPLKRDFPISRLADKNFSVKLGVSIESPTVAQNTAAVKTYSASSLETKVAGRLDFTAKGFWRDAPSKILNSGPYPPKVNVPTQYTIHWILKNYGADASGIHISAFLQSGARFTGKVNSTINTIPAYNANTGEVTWDIPTLPANFGVIGNPIEAIFQIEATPAVNAVGGYIPLVGVATLSATDAYVTMPVEARIPIITSQIPDDVSLGNIVRSVMP